MQKIILTLILFNFVGCAFIFKGSEQRKLQTKILAKLSEKSPEFKDCANKSKLYSKLNNKRVRVILYLDLAPTGNIEKFKLDDNNYPEQFTNCMFNTVELINFPKFDTHELLRIEQPFIFSKK